MATTPNQMTYPKLKQWLTHWMNENEEPVPLYWDNFSSISPDCRILINIAIKTIDHIDDNTSLTKSYFSNLKKIKEAIENKQHDISVFGYTINDKFKKQ